MIKHGNLVRSKKGKANEFETGLVVSDVYPSIVVRSSENNVSYSGECLVVDVLSCGKIYTRILIDSIELLEN